MNPIKTKAKKDSRWPALQNVLALFAFKAVKFSFRQIMIILE